MTDVKKTNNAISHLGLSSKLWIQRIQHNAHSRRYLLKNTHSKYYEYIYHINHGNRINATGMYFCASREAILCWALVIAANDLLLIYIGTQQIHSCKEHINLQVNCVSVYCMKNYL